MAIRVVSTPAGLTVVQGKPAIVVSENFFGGDGNPCYHQSCDKVDKVNFDYMTRLTTALARAVAELVVKAE